MVKKRKFCAYRALERPYTRFSRYKKMSYVKARPPCRIARFDVGDPTKKFDYTLKLIAKASLQIRDNALESGRLSANKILEENLGKGGYRLTLMTYPHHILRENPLASGAGADRMSTGMQRSFGKTIGIAAQVFRGQPVFIAHVDKENLELGKKALKRASYKMPCSFTIEIIQENKPKAKAI